MPGRTPTGPVGGRGENTRARPGSCEPLQLGAEFLSKWGSEGSCGPGGSDRARELTRGAIWKVRARPHPEAGPACLTPECLSSLFGGVRARAHCAVPTRRARQAGRGLSRGVTVTPSAGKETPWPLLAPSHPLPSPSQAPEAWPGRGGLWRWETACGRVRPAATPLLPRPPRPVSGKSHLRSASRDVGAGARRGWVLCRSPAGPRRRPFRGLHLPRM